MGTIEVASDAITDYPIPLPHGTRVRLRKDTALTNTGTLGTVLPPTHSSNPKGCHVLFDGEVKTEYILALGYTKPSVEDYFDVLGLPGADLMYLGVRHATVPEARGIIVAVSGGDAVVMRTHEYLGLGTQDWGGQWVTDDDPPTYATDYGEMKLGQRVIFTAPWAGMRGTVVGHKDGATYFLVDAGQAGFDTPPEWSDPDNRDTDTMFSPSSCEWHKLGDEIGSDQAGNALRIGDRVVYEADEIGDGDWPGVVGTVLAKHHMGTLVTLVLDPVRQDGSPVGPDQQEYVGPHGKGCNLQSLSMTVLSEKKDTGYKSKLGKPIYVGDVLEYIPGNPDWAGVVVKALDPKAGGKRYEFVETNAFTEASGYGVGDAINLTPSDLAHVVEGTALGAAFKYADGVPIKIGDRVVYNPGFPEAGIAATVVGPDPSGKLVKVDRDDGEGKSSIWTVGNFSRLQDEDKEKVADQFQSVEALPLVEQLFEKLDSLKDELEGQIETIGAELTSAEQREIDVEFDSDNVEYDVSVSTAPERLIGYFAVSDGEVTVDDSAVDEYLRETAEVSWSGGASVELESYLADLHSAFATGRDKVGEYLETLDEIKSIVAQVLSDPGIKEAAQTAIVTPDLAQFYGKVTAVRFGVVLPEDAETGPALRFDVVADHINATRRVRLVGKQIGTFLATVGVSDVQALEGRMAKLQEDPYGGWYPTAVAELAE